MKNRAEIGGYWLPVLITLAGPAAAYAAPNLPPAVKGEKLPIGVGLSWNRSTNDSELALHADYWAHRDIALSVHGHAGLSWLGTSWGTALGVTGRLLVTANRDHAMLVGALAGLGATENGMLWGPSTTTRFAYVTPSVAYEWAGFVGDIVLGIETRLRFDRSALAGGISPRAFVRVVFHPARPARD